VPSPFNPSANTNHRLTLLNPTTPIQNHASRSALFNLKHQYELIRVRAKNSRIENTRWMLLLLREANAQALYGRSFYSGPKRPNFNADPGFPNSNGYQSISRTSSHYYSTSAAAPPSIANGGTENYGMEYRLALSKVRGSGTAPVLTLWKSSRGVVQAQSSPIR